MTVSIAQLSAGPVQLSATTAAVVTCPQSTQLRIDRAVLSNSSSSAVAVQCFVVPASGSPSAANQIELATNGSMTGEQSYVSPELAGLVLTPGQTVQFSESTGTYITVIVSGIAVT